MKMKNGVKRKKTHDLIFYILLQSIEYSEFRSISELKKLLASNCKIEKVYPQVFASDAEVNIVTVVVKCPDGKTQTIRAYREEAHALRGFLRTCT